MPYISLQAPCAEYRAQAIAYARSGGTDRLIARLRGLARPGEHKVALAIVAAFILLIALILPSLAYGDPVSDIINGVTGAIGDAINNALTNLMLLLFGGVIKFLINFTNAILQLCTAREVITGVFENLFGYDFGQGATIYTFAETISTTIVKPAAQSILSIVVFVQLFKIAAEMDSHGGTLPGVREVFKLFIMLGIFMFLVDHGFELMQALFDLLQRIVVGVQGTLDQGVVSTIDPGKMQGVGPADILFYTILAFLVFIVTIFMGVVTIFVAIGRAITIYLYATFSPIPFALMGFDETRGWSLGFIKNFVAECFSGAIMVFALILFPIMLNSALGFTSESFDLGWVIFTIAVEVATIFALLRSGQIARQILGGM